MNLTYERAHEVLSYNPETGVFRWKSHHFSTFVGRLAGSSKGARGRLSLCIDSARYEGHRVAWLMTYGAFPDAQIDHINRNPLDNRIENLRLATPSQNTTNRSGVKGYTKLRTGRFQAQIKLSGKCKYLGSFASDREAREVYLAASRAIHGDFGVAAGEGAA